MSEQENQPPTPSKRRRIPRTKTQEKEVPAQQGAPVQAASPPHPASLPSPGEPPIGEKWREFPPVERQAELQRKYEAWKQKRNHKERSGPFADIKLTGADVFWLAVYIAGEGDIDAGRRNLIISVFSLPDDLSDLHLEGADLSEAYLDGAYLQGAHLERARLYGAHLEGAIFSQAYLEEADLHEAHLEGSDLGETHLERATLTDTYLEEADLHESYLQGADLLGAHLKLIRKPVGRESDHTVESRSGHKPDARRLCRYNQTSPSVPTNAASD